jgi:DNA-directed RNA polymerase subunit N (RpoN/RPB10)
MRIFQTLDLKKGVKDLVIQYNKIYPFDDMQIDQSLGNQLSANKNIQLFFSMLFEVSERALSDDRRPQSNVNMIKELLDSEGINKMCCRQTILTSCDFYESMAFYANVLQ